MQLQNYFDCHEFESKYLVTKYELQFIQLHYNDFQNLLKFRFCFFKTCVEKLKTQPQKYNQILQE